MTTTPPCYFCGSTHRPVIRASIFIPANESIIRDAVCDSDDCRKALAARQRAEQDSRAAR